jgi:hypothetical protein
LTAQRTAHDARHRVHGIHHRLWLPFALVNLGCALRVSLQIATDLAPAAYPLVAISSVLEVAGIAIWGVHLWRIMNGWNPAALPESTNARPEQITGDHSPGRVVDWFPPTLAVFLRHGLTPLANPLLRRTIGRSISLRTAATARGIALENLVREVNEAIRSRRATGPDGPNGERPASQDPTNRIRPKKIVS